jgi:Holliday junction resolvase
VSKAKARGTSAETAVVRYLQQWWPAAERRALSGNKDKGDVAGIPGVCIEVKAAKDQKLAAWQRETLAEMKNAGAEACMLVVKRPYKTAARWDAYLQAQLLDDTTGGFIPAEELGSWVRMDLVLAAALLGRMGFTRR